jgi:hypothetical protein
MAAGAEETIKNDGAKHVIPQLRDACRLLRAIRDRIDCRAGCQA